MFSVTFDHLGMISCWRLEKKEGILNMLSSFWLEAHRNIMFLNKKKNHITIYYLFPISFLSSKVFSVTFLHLGIISCWRLEREEGILNMSSSYWLEAHRQMTFLNKKITYIVRSKYLKVLLDLPTDLILTDIINPQPFYFYPGLFANFSFIIREVLLRDITILIYMS